MVFQLRLVSLVRHSNGVGTFSFSIAVIKHTKIGFSLIPLFASVMLCGVPYLLIADEVLL